MDNHTDRQKSQSYHHGDLRNALIQAGLELLSEGGAQKLDLRKVARAAGVSHAAPYRHFRDRDELMAEVAQRGFERFAGALAVAWDDGRPDAMSAFTRVGRAYLAFARSEPAYYTAMFEAGIPLDRHPELLSASERAFAVLRHGSDALLTKLPEGAKPPVAT